MATIQFTDVSRVFERDGKDFLILDKINLTVQDEEFVAIVGPSGCGKTTCMRMAAGLEFPSSGSVKVNDVQVTEPGPDRAVVFQQFALFPWKTVHENIDFGLRSKGLGKEERESLITHYIALMNPKALTRINCLAGCSNVLRLLGLMHSTHKCS
jgi:NitT/TauT family transport system ATP-binding protein